MRLTGFSRRGAWQDLPSCICPQPPAARVFLTTVAGCVIRSVEMGEGGREFVLVHGLGMSGRYLMPTAKRLAIHGRVHVPDLPGFGKSGKPSHVLTVSQLSDSLVEWIDARKIHAPVLIGNSLGAQVIVDFAARYPSRLRAAVLVGPTIDPEARRASIQILRLLADIPREPVRLYPIAAGDYFRAGFARCLRTLRHALEDPVTEKLPLIRVPVLVVRGGLDPIVPQPWVERVVRSIPQARCVTISGAGHAVNFNSPDELVREMLDFFHLTEEGNLWKS